MGFILCLDIGDTTCINNNRLCFLEICTITAIGIVDTPFHIIELQQSTLKKMSMFTVSCIVLLEKSVLLDWSILIEVIDIL